MIHFIIFIIILIVIFLHFIVVTLIMDFIQIYFLIKNISSDHPQYIEKTSKMFWDFEIIQTDTQIF